jgi:hypothetical protein
MTALEQAIRTHPGRCQSCGYHVPTQGCRCPGGDWVVFRDALLAVADKQGVIHQSAMRRLIRGRVPSKSIGQFYRRAKSEGLIVDTGEREPSDDVAGRNSDKLDRVYRVGSGVAA